MEKILINGEEICCLSYINKLTRNQLKLYLKGGGNINYQNEYKNTALIEASYYGNIKTIHLLLKNGADYNLQGAFGYNSLILSAFYGYFEIVKLLLKYNIDIQLRNKYNENALICSFNHKHYKITNLLLNQKLYYSKILKIKKLNIKLIKLIYKI